METYNQELHTNYQKAIQAFLGVYPFKTEGMSSLIDSYCRTCALYLWNGFSVDPTVCARGINEIYAEDRYKKVYTAAQVEKAFNTLSQKNYILPVPNFFEKIAKRDRSDGTNYSRKLASCLSLVFISFALIDGNVEAEEAKMITKLQQDLVSCCDDNKVTAYTLNGNSANNYGQEAIDTLLKAMEDRRDNFVVIVAGYTDLMDSFVQSNPGLESRFNRYVHFEDYTSDEMYHIFRIACDSNQYTLTEDAVATLNKHWASVSAAAIGNGRGARNLFEKVVTQQAKRISAQRDIQADELSVITKEDIVNALV